MTLLTISPSSFPSALTETNKYCAAHCASNLILDSTLNSIAQAYADKLVALGYLVYSDNQSCGGNLYFTSSTQAIDINSITGITFKKFLFVFIFYLNSINRCKTS